MITCAPYATALRREPAGPATVCSPAREVAAIANRRGVEVFAAFCESHTTQVPHLVSRLLRAATGVRNRIVDVIAVSQRFRGFRPLTGMRENSSILIEGSEFQY